jgi:NOL1/NOP2/fmu family ribosome biogenesis protein
MKASTTYKVQYLKYIDEWVSVDSTHKLIGFARREASRIKRSYPGTKTRILKSSFAIVK